MPVESCQRDGRPGYRWGQAGTCYTYAPGSDSAREAAHARAARQGRAIEASKSARSRYGEVLIPLTLVLALLGAVASAFWALRDASVLFGCHPSGEVGMDQDSRELYRGHDCAGGWKLMEPSGTTIDQLRPPSYQGEPETGV